MILFIAAGNCRVIVVDDLHRHGSSADEITRPKLLETGQRNAGTDQMNDLFSEYERNGLTKKDILSVLKEVSDTPLMEAHSTVRNEWMPKRDSNSFDELLRDKEQRSARYRDNLDFLESDRAERNFSRQKPSENMFSGFTPNPTNNSYDHSKPEYINPRNTYPTKRPLKTPKKFLQPTRFKKKLYVPIYPTETSGYHHFLSDNIQLEETASKTQPNSSSIETENFLNPNINLRKKQTKINSLQNSLRLRENNLNKLQKRLEEQESLKKKNTDLLKNLQKNIERNEKELKQKVASLKLLNNEINEKQKVVNGLQYDYNKKQKEKELIGDLLKQYVGGIPGIENKIDGAENLIKNLTNEKDTETQKVCKEKEKLHNLMKESNQDMQKLQEALFKLGNEN